MVDVTKAGSLELATLKHMLDVAVNDAALALKRSTEALIAWGDAFEEFRAGRQTALFAMVAEERFNEALAKRLMCDAKVDYLQKKLEGRS